ncbi:MAG: zinc-dependent alcohol dehydrogenase family protein [Anaerolineales bacterium]
MKAIQIEQPNHIALIDIPWPEPGPGDVLIQVMASGICGTDLHIVRGEYMGGYPLIPGHEFAGVVTEVGAEVTRFKAGDRVAVEPNIACGNCDQCLQNRQNFCRHWEAIGVTRPGGMAQYVVAPEPAVFDIGALPFAVGAFMEPLSCVLHGVEKARVQLADRVAILGAGPIGLLLMQVVRARGAAEITIVEKNPARAAFAETFGADHCYRELDALPADAYDVVVDATGVIPVMARAIEFARRGGAVLLFGVPPAGEPMTWTPFQLFQKGLTVVSSFTSVRNSFQAVAMLRSRQVEVEPLVSHRLPLAEFEKGVRLIAAGAEEVKKVLIFPHAES